MEQQVTGRKWASVHVNECCFTLFPSSPFSVHISTFLFLGVIF